MSTPTPTNNEQMDELRKTLLEQQSQQMIGTTYESLVISAESNFEWKMRLSRVENSVDQIMSLFAQHYVPIGQASDEGLREQIEGMVWRLPEFELHEDDATDLIERIMNAATQHTKEAVEAAYEKGREVGTLETQLAYAKQTDICKCGDYRRDHENGTGVCMMADDSTHGFKPCKKFRLAALSTTHSEKAGDE